VLERTEESPAARLATHSMVGDWNNPEVLLRLAAQSDVVILENEFVNADSLLALEQAGHALWPRSETIRRIQDKLIQKQTFAEAGILVPKFRAVTDRDSILRAGAEWGWPLVLKTRRNGYDGKGNATIGAASEIDAAWHTLNGDLNALLVEQYCPFVAELAVIVTRGRNGDLVTYPLVESVQREHICHVVKAPATTAPEVAAQALDLARRAVLAVDGVGSFGIEMFLTAAGTVLLNEVAPRVHNTGHFTIEACVCSQFENHVRAVFGWPLGSTAMVAPAAVMLNLLGTSPGPGRARGLGRALAVSGAHVHLYGKSLTTPGRKMGHVTALGETVEEALAVARRAADHLQFGNA
jgi:5-(carboxyamino)imidazole ribonucleotide synthase